MKVALLAILIYLSSLGCKTGDAGYTKYESQKIESLITLHYLNDKTVIIKFGYDAVTALKTTEGIVVVDAGISSSLTNRYKKLIGKVFNQKRIRYVINTHGHHDHIRGNSVFPDAQIIGHENCRIDTPKIEHTDSSMIRVGKIVDQYDQQLRQLSPDSPEWENVFTQKIRYASAYLDMSENLPFKLPDTIFSDTLNLKCGDVTFEMIYFGKFHSSSDILIYTPELRILFTGDLFSKYGRPSMSNSSISDAVNWRQAFLWIETRVKNITTIIDGHGQILSIDDLNRFSVNIKSKYSDIKK